MRLLDKIMGRAVAAPIPDAAQGARILAQTWGSPDAERLTISWANGVRALNLNPIIFGLVQRRMSLFSEAEFKFQKLSDKSLFGNTDLLLLEVPWPNGTTGDLLSRMEQDVSLAGNSYIRAVGPDRLERLRPDAVTIISAIIDEGEETEHREILGYWYDASDDLDREARYFPVEEVAHWAPYPDPLANWRGMSWITPVLREIAADEDMTEYKRAYLENSATPNMVIKYAAEVKQSTLDRVRDQMAAKYSGPKNAFKTLVLDSGADPMILGNSFEQMAFSAVQQAGENRMAVAGGVPAVVAGLAAGLDSSSYNFYLMAMRSFTDLTMRPLWRGACAALAKLVAIPDGARLWFDVSGIAALRQGEKESADMMLVLSQSAQALVMAGYTPESINAALSAADVTLLKHSGLVSVQMQQLQAKKEEQTDPIGESNLAPVKPADATPASPATLKEEA